MRILPDECVPWPMQKLLSVHECSTAQRRGWGAVKNGDLLRLAEQEFDLFITSDQGTPLMPSPRVRCMNSVARLPGRTVRK